MLTTAAISAATIGSLSGVPVRTSTTTGRVIAAPAPVAPPRYLTGPGIKIAGYPDLPATYDFPLENTQIDTATGMLIRQSGYPLPLVPNLVKYSDGKWYQAPTNSWQYTQSPLQPYNQAAGSSPFAGKTPDTWALLNNDNFVNLSTGEVFNNIYTPVPEIQVIPRDGKAYAVPRDPFQFMESPLQPYNFDSNLPKPTQVPPMAFAGEVGFKQGYNPATIDILSEIQGLPLNYNYNLNTPEVVPEVVVASPIAVDAPTTAPATN
jgi:hypothetical protein